MQVRRAEIQSVPAAAALMAAPVAGRAGTLPSWRQGRFRPLGQSRQQSRGYRPARTPGTRLNVDS
jgi:hypothetical protein